MEPKKENKQEPKKVPAIKAQNGGLLVGQDYEKQWQLAQTFAASNMLPQQYRNQPSMVLTAMQYAFELGLRPLSAMRQMAVINGSPALFGDLPLALVRNSKKLTYFKEFNIDSEMNEICFENKNLYAEKVGAVCIVQRVGGEKRSFSFTLEDAKRAGLLGRDTWQKYPDIMLKYRARSAAVKSEFGDVLSGIGIAEYDYNLAPDGMPMAPEENQIDAENQACINAIESIFKQLNYTRAMQTQIINKYDGHGSLKRINLDGLILMLDELKTIKGKQFGSNDADVIDAEAFSQGNDDEEKIKIEKAD